MNKLLSIWAATAAGAILVLGARQAVSGIAGTVHDLAQRADTTEEICVFCHTPHNAAPQTPLWNRANPRTFYRIYESSTTDARIDQPSGPSKMCLSCHDGSMALGIRNMSAPA